MKRMLMVTAICAALAGCATPPPEVTTVKVEVPVPCIEAAPQRPDYRTGDGPYPGDVKAASILANDFEQAEQYGHAWEAAAAGCVKTERPDAAPQDTPPPPGTARTP